METEAKIDKDALLISYEVAESMAKGQKSQEGFITEMQTELFAKGNPNRHNYHILISLSCVVVLISPLLITDFGLGVYQAVLAFSFIISIVAFLFMRKNEKTMYAKEDKFKAYLPMFATNVFFFFFGLFISQASPPTTNLMPIEIGFLVAVSILAFLVFSLDYSKLTEKSARGLLLIQTLIGLFAIVFSLNLILFNVSGFFALSLLTFLYYYGLYATIQTFTEVAYLEVSLGVAGI